MKLSDDYSHLQMLNSAEVMALFRMSKSTLWRHIGHNKFPKPVYLGSTPLWHKQTLERLVEGLGVNFGAIGVTQATDRRREIDEFC